MKMQSKVLDPHKLKAILKLLATFTSTSTCLISLYVPGTQGQVNVASETIKQELSLAANIKSKETRKAVKDALTKIQNAFRNASFPVNGLVFFAGTSPAGKMECRVVKPPQPVVFSYRCDKQFIVHVLEAMLIQGPLIGVALFDGKSLVVGECQDARRTIFCKDSVRVPKKHGRGGQSANRFARQRV